MSKYPQELDTSIEIPPVRDNITEIGSEVINSLRAAIFKIEGALGINPQGATGNTLAARISRSLDANGNLLSDALTRANVLSGPIIDADVSRVASIQESKLKLDYPTTLLQDEISILNSQLDTIETLLAEVAASLSIHLETRALSQHSALSIDVASADVIASDIATLSLEEDDLQATLEKVYNAHMNYSGVNISETNNAHKANQIFFDNEETSDIIFSNDLQGAIEDLADVEAVGFRNALLNITSNGRVRKGSVSNDFEDNQTNTILIDTAIATYVQAAGASTTTFSYGSSQNTLGAINRFDLLTLAGAETEEDNTSYQISEVITDGSGLVQDVIVYGGPKGDSTAGLTIQITKNPYATYNPHGFTCVARPRSTKTNTPDIQFLNPDCAIIVSDGILPGSILSTAHTFDIIIDDGNQITINTYDSSASVQTIDTVVQKINDQFIDNHLNAMAYKVRSDNCYELAIAHNLPNITGDVIERTIELFAGSTNDGTGALGFGNLLGSTVRGSSGNTLNLNGLLLDRFGLIQTFTEDDIELVSGILSLSLASGTFAELGIRVGDMAIITGSSDSSDNGSYRIGSLTGSTAVLDLSGKTFDGVLETDSRVYIIRNSSNIGELDFEEVIAADGTILFDIFISEGKDVFYSKRMEISGALRSGTFFAAISDVSRDFITRDQTASLSISTSGYATLTDPTLQSGEEVFVGITGVYKIFGSDGLSFITLDVSATAPPLLTQSVNLFGFNEISSNNYHISRGGFSTSLGRVLGTSSNPGVPTLIDKRISGTTDHTVISETFIERYIEGPRNELRASGVIRGCQVVNPTFIDVPTTYQNFSVEAGIIVVNGIRREFPGLANMRIDTGDTYIVVMDEFGCIQASTYITDPLGSGNLITPYFENNVVYLAEISNDGSNATVVDLRFFIDNLDFKALSEISVANDSKHGHFTDISEAIAYCKRFGNIFPEMSSPSILIKPGTYEIESTILIDVDLYIKGSGPSTILTKSDSFAPGTAMTGDGFDMETAIFMIGGGATTNADDITYGVSFSDFTYVTSDEITHVGCVFALTQPLTKNGDVVSRRATYRFENITFDGPATQDGSIADPNKVGEFALLIGQQNPHTLSPTANLVMGNVIFTNCRLNRMGLEEGAIKFTESSASTFKDIIISNNIVTRGSPNVGSTAAVVLEYPTTPSTENIVEVGNTFRTAN